MFNKCSLTKKCSTTFVFKFTKVAALSCGRVMIKIFSPGRSDGNKDIFYLAQEKNKVYKEKNGNKKKKNNRLIAPSINYSIKTVANHIICLGRIILRCL